MKYEKALSGILRWVPTLILVAGIVLMYMPLAFWGAVLMTPWAVKRRRKQKREREQGKRNVEDGMGNKDGCVAGAEQEVKHVKHALEEISKQTKWAVIALATIVGIHVLLAIATFLLSDFVEDAVNSNNIYIFISIGLVVLGLLVGIHRRSRVCAVIVLIAGGIYIGDELVSARFLSWDIIDYIVSSAWFFGAVFSLSSSFEYDALLEKYWKTANTEIAALLKASRPKKRRKA